MVLILIAALAGAAALSCSKSSDNKPADNDNAAEETEQAVEESEPAQENDKDAEETPDYEKQCDNSFDCALGFYCGAYYQCMQNCNDSDKKCKSGEFCNGLGQCVELRPADNDAEDVLCQAGTNVDCPTGYVCGDNDKCVEGCDSRADCPVYWDCANRKCFKPGIDGDEETGCKTSDDCPQGKVCSGGLCVFPNQDGDAEEFECMAACATDLDCNPGNYCGAGNCCRRDCSENKDCPQGLLCQVERGKCVNPPTDQDNDVPEAIACTAEPDSCAIHSYCKNGVCDFDCIEDKDCNDPKKSCDNKGRCVTADADADADVDKDDALNSCGKDEDCPAGYYCASSLLKCAFDCQNNDQCGPGSYCDNRGRCQTSAEEGDQDNHCLVNEDCILGYYCGPNNVCVADCYLNHPCEDGYICDARGRCVLAPEQDETEPDFTRCAKDDDCPSNMYCQVDICGRDCETNANCMQGYICSPRGKCVIDYADYDQTESYCGPVPPVEKACAKASDCRLIMAYNNCQCDAAGPKEYRETIPPYIWVGSDCIIDANNCQTAPECASYPVDCVNNVCVLLGGDADADVPAKKKKK